MVLALLTCQAIAQPNGGERQKKEKPQMAYQVGDLVEDFEMKNVDGKMVSLAQMDNVNGFIIIFTSNTCPYAIAYEDRIIALHNEMAAKGYPVIAINPNDPSVESGDGFEQMVTRHKEKAFPFLYLKDEKGVFRKFGANKTPHVFLLDADLKVQYIGAIDDNARDAANVNVVYVKDAIMALEEGRSPDPATTKAIGCSIKTNRGDGQKGGRPQGPPNPEALMERMDANNDQQISKTEAKGPLARDFDKLDADGDGILTLSELSNMKKGRKGQ